MNAYSLRWREKVLDLDYCLEYWADRYARLLDGYRRDREVVPAAQQFHVLFSEFVGDDVATVRRIYETAGIELTAQADRELHDFMANHYRGSQGQMVHDLRADFGADPAAIRERYSAYTDWSR
jgi:hypothetical protein